MIDVATGLPTRAAAEAQSFKIQRRHARRLKLFEPVMVRMATWRSFVMLDPRNMMRNPVMFLVEVGTVLTAIVTVQSILARAATGLIVYQAALTFLLLLTVLFANFAEALAEARGKAQADSLRATRADTPAFRLAPLAVRLRARSSPRPSSGAATSSSSRPARSSRPTARSSRGSPRSTSRRSPARAPRSSARPAATTRASPAARASCPTGSSSRSPPSRARASSTG